MMSLNLLFVTELLCSTLQMVLLGVARKIIFIIKRWLLDGKQTSFKWPSTK